MPAFLSGGGETGAAMRSHDWSDFPLGDPEVWPTALKISLALILASPESMYLAWGPDFLFFSNDAYRPILGPRLPQSVGTTLPALWPDAWDAVRPLVARTFAGEALRFEDLPITMARHGVEEETWWTFSYSPIRDETGAVVGLFCITNETTDRVKAVVANRDSDVRNRQILDSAIDYAIVATDAQGRITRWNEGARRVLGWSEEEMLGQPADRFFTPEDRALDRPAIEMRNALVGGHGNDERWHMRKNKERFWAVGEMTVLRDASGKAAGFVKVLRDRTDQHLTGLELEALQAQLQQAQEAGGVGLFSVDIPSGRIKTTKEFSRLYGLDHREVRPASEVEATIVPEDRALVSTDETRRAGVAVADVEYRIRRPRDGALRWIARKGEIRFDAEGRPARFIGVARDVTDHVAARRLIENERERFARMFEQAPSFMTMLQGPEHVFEFVNPAYMRLIGQRDVIGKPVAEALPEAVGQGFIDLLDGVYRSGEVFATSGIRYAFQAEPDGPVTERFVDLVYQPTMDAEGRVTGIFSIGSDVTERTVAATALRDSESFLRSVLASSNDCIKVLDLDARLVFMSEGGQKVMEVSDFNEIAGCPWPDFWREEGNADARAAVASAQAGVPANFQGYAETMKGTRRYWDVQVSPILGADGRPERILSVSRDMTAMKQAEEVRTDLSHELAHRMKNTLAMVQAIVTSTLRNAATTAEAAESITGRLATLSRAQDVLTQTNWAGADIHEVVEGVLMPLRPDGDRIRVIGPKLDLAAQQALGLSLALHELATNAAKYGALSNDVGTVEIIWERDVSGRFVFDWTERGGPVVAKPTRTGFGSRLMERIVASYFDGSTELLFEVGGVRFHLEGVAA